MWCLQQMIAQMGTSVRVCGPVGITTKERAKAGQRVSCVDDALIPHLRTLIYFVPSMQAVCGDQSDWKSCAPSPGAGENTARR